MPHNQIKKYPDLLEIMHYSEFQRKKSLRAIFDRDITDNDKFIFNKKIIRPTKIDGEIDLGTVFNHLISEDYFEKDENGKTVKSRVFEKDRAHRLHWLKPHIEVKIKDTVFHFSVMERDPKKRKDVPRTYLLNTTQKYVVVLEPQNSGLDYYLITAYYLNKKYGLKQMKKKMKNKLAKLL
ncbi:hypothetical protein [Polaribacter ponticola]|uniref:Uncharacterized protein n=1 Tax=Polaribacter ponticola TaxID=2978475 RepID=A0ABT5SBM7_9FLAO|nr:hypothetical protein [Polaribacter sp. MSW5]MDD7915485.1 hypothetical protein [Polaribacter sp. MSW5]